jgi:ATP-dependent protease ClpP protease subunit
MEHGDNEVDFYSVTPVLRAIDKMLDLSNKPIEIHMSSYGGDAYQMLALYDKIQESPCKFIFYGSGMIMSAATWIMCGCDERYLSENTTVLIHDGSIDFLEWKTTDNRIASDENERLQRRLEKIYADNSYMDEAFWKTVSRRDLFLTADEAVALGLADNILAYKKRGNFRKGARKETFDNPPDKRTLKKEISKLFKRIKVEVPQNLEVSIRKEESEDIKDYDYTEKEMKHLGLDSTLDGEKDEKKGV